ncbi:hypothetical protein ACFQZE_10065 [Paenibacillus sp. GCM10027627]|uniref:hypothetical protein n=1 Tax=unclassified Paenibacillus TaxID=185978 RepID=UPI003642E7E9
MFGAMMLLHVLGAVGMGFYIVLPIMLGGASKAEGNGQAGLAGGLLSANRIAQYFLIIQLLTGGYLMAQGEYAVIWMIIVTALFLGIAAVGGIVTKPLKLVVSSIQNGQSASAHINKAKVLSLVVLVLYVAMIFFMVNPIFK